MKSQRTFLNLIAGFPIAVLIFACNGTSDNKAETTATTNATPTINYTYIKSHPHDTTAFTEGFVIHFGKLYESTGASPDLPQTRSLFGTVDLKTGEIDTKVELDKHKYFGEGIAFLNGQVFQLTYKTKIGFVYDALTFKKVKEFTFPSEEGWGLTTDGTNLIMSDGTSQLTYLAPINLQMIKRVSVVEDGYAKNNLNELEYIKGFIYANIWLTNTIVKIDPTTGKVVGKLDLGSLAHDAKNLYSGSLEMNGIAYDSLANKVFVTGKLWPKIFELQLNQ
ncbi:glutaminyl-peptide cyclotransferase [Daejeonella lutea]|uniref:Glutamine cyclotransferase n=1 Tax=Daejeonella lutea TaxID=572036 RepID=A0A1T4ZWT3_9SPHI|nr:glutaminyl-peptide cyclotransferase [Daejeonella lutea]SKB27188.1 Glutamine cyclotransferase [Daejeonella lutea]